MRTLRKALAAALLCAPLAAAAQGNRGPTGAAVSEPAGVESPGAGYSQGVAAGWQYTGRGARTVRAGGAAAAGVIVAAAAAATLRNRR